MCRACFDQGGWADWPVAAAWEPRRFDLPVGWTGSISHARGIAVAAVARSGGILGLDVEEIVVAEHAVGIRASVALPGELDVFDGMPMEQALTLLFSAEESLNKTLYLQFRRFFDFSAARVVAIGACDLTLLISRAMGFWLVGRRRRFSQIHGWECARIHCDAPLRRLPSRS